MVKKKEKKINIKTKKVKIITPEKTTAPTVWSPFDILDTMDRLFWEDPWIPMWRRRWRSMIPIDTWYDRWLEPDKKQAIMDIIDKGREFKVVAEMPGVSKSDIDVNITDNNISICGKTKTEIEKEDEGYIRRERSYSTLCRTMMFPEEVNPAKAEAILRDGILEVNVAKKKPTKGRSLRVK